MSTVVFRDGVLAADTLMVQGSVKCPEGMNKIVMGTTHPVIYAMAGRTAALATAVRMIEAMPVAPWEGGQYAAKLPLDGGSELAVFHRDGRIFSVETDGWWFQPARAPFMALGSGAKAALGALHMGADAVRAVEIASMVDAFSGGAVVTLRIADIGRKPVEALPPGSATRLAPRPLPQRAPRPVPERVSPWPKSPARQIDVDFSEDMSGVVRRQPAPVLNRFRHEPRAALSRAGSESAVRTASARWSPGSRGEK